MVGERAAALDLKLSEEKDSFNSRGTSVCFILIGGVGSSVC